jgi:hypothetical protein
MHDVLPLFLSAPRATLSEAKTAAPSKTGKAEGPFCAISRLSVQTFDLTKKRGGIRNAAERRPSGEG